MKNEKITKVRRRQNLLVDEEEEENNYPSTQKITIKIRTKNARF